VNVTTISNSSIFSVPSACGLNVTCSSQLDLILVIDDSRSVNDTQWNQTIAFTSSFVNSFSKASVFEKSF
jgi:hypothetical protein